MLYLWATPRSFDIAACTGNRPWDAAECIAQHPEVAYVQLNYNVSAYSMRKEKTCNWNLKAI